MSLPSLLGPGALPLPWASLAAPRSRAPSEPGALPSAWEASHPPAPLPHMSAPMSSVQRKAPERPDETCFTHSGTCWAFYQEGGNRGMGWADGGAGGGEWGPILSVPICCTTISRVTPPKGLLSLQTKEGLGGWPAARGVSLAQGACVKLSSAPPGLPSTRAQGAPCGWVQGTLRPFLAMTFCHVPVSTQLLRSGHAEVREYQNKCWLLRTCLPPPPPRLPHSTIRGGETSKVMSSVAHLRGSPLCEPIPCYRHPGGSNWGTIQDPHMPVTAVATMEDYKVLSPRPL